MLQNEWVGQHGDPMRSRPSVTLVVVIAALAASCSDSSTGPSNPGTPDVAELLGEMSLSSVAGPAASGVPVAGAFVSSGPPIGPSACAFSSTTGAFTCPTVTLNGLTFTRTYWLLDGAGQPQSKPDASTASIRTLTTVKGTLTVALPELSPTRSLDVDRTEDMTLSGIRTTHRTLNGTATSKTSGTVTNNGETLTSRTESTERVVNLVLPDRRSGQRWPTGKIIVDATSMATRNGQQSFTSTTHTEITYNGTSLVTITVTSGFGTHTCTIDLTKPGPGACVFGA